MRSRLLQRGLALGLLLGLVAAVAASAWDWADAYADGQHEIADKRAQLGSLRELADARAGFERLTRKGSKGPLILAADANPQDALSAAINRAVEGQEVILDGIDALSPETATVSATVRLRGTQRGLHAFLRAIEEQTPYLTVPRLDITLFRAADLERHKPLVLSAELRVAALTAPVVTPHPATPSAEGR